MEKPLTNLQEWTVSGLSGALKRTLEDAYGYVRLKGEVSGYRGPHSSGHVYFAIKDQNAKIDAIIWKGNFQRLKVKPQEGLEVVVTGKITTFAGKSSYQIIIENVEPAGAGALMMLLEERRARLAAEGLFDESRKKALPFLPRLIGVVTSPTGAVIRDILHRLEDRFPRHVLVWPVRVQGETSANEIATAIHGFNALDPNLRPDLLIIARGGGSLEDLWSFNEEEVVRAVAQSHIPVISAIGHETDWTLIDLAADRRAPTPTGAAEMAVPVRVDLLAGLRNLHSRHHESMLRFIQKQRSDVRALVRALPQPDSLMANKRQRLDLAVAKLKPAFAQGLRRHEVRFLRSSQNLQTQAPKARLLRYRDKFESLSSRLQAARLNEQARLGLRHTKIKEDFDRMNVALQALHRRKVSELGAREALLGSLSYKSVLSRGFAIVRDEHNKIVRAASDVQPQQALIIEFAESQLKVKSD